MVCVPPVDRDGRIPDRVEELRESAEGVATPDAPPVEELDADVLILSDRRER